MKVRIINYIKKMIINILSHNFVHNPFHGTEEGFKRLEAIISQYQNLNLKRLKKTLIKITVRGSYFFVSLPFIKLCYRIRSLYKISLVQTEPNLRLNRADISAYC